VHFPATAGILKVFARNMDTTSGRPTGGAILPSGSSYTSLASSKTKYTGACHGIYETTIAKLRMLFLLELPLSGFLWNPR
jgi:hypothetical protein